MSANKFYLTTPIYYVNARPHLGHAYTTIVADVLARRHRLLGDDTYLLTGTDEHGQKIERSAAAAGVPPQQFADQVSKTFSDLWARMGITNDQFIRTTDPRHKVGVQKLFATLYERGHIYLDTYTGSYCVSDEAFVDAPVGTPCPDCGRLLEEVTEENFFFKLRAFQQPLIDLIESNTLVITPDSSRNEVLSFIQGNFKTHVDEYVEGYYRNGGPPGAFPDGDLRQIAYDALPVSATGTKYVPGALKDLSISRSSFTWGIPVPEEVQKAAGTKQEHVIYVWLDALANYMTALGYGNDDDFLWQKFWPADLHLVGKEITRFHCVYWPAFLLAAGLPLPKQVTANGWLLFDNSKMSKSKGNVVRAETILDAFGTLCPPPVAASAVAEGIGADAKGMPQRLKPDSNVAVGGTAEAVPYPIDAPSIPADGEASAHDRDLFATDVLRYYLLREIPFGQDGSFSFDSLITRYNADLANGLGNLASRTFKMIELYFQNVIPAATEAALQFGVIEILPDAVEDALLAHLDRHEFASFLEGIAHVVAATDNMLTVRRPWKERENELATTLNRQFCLHVAAAVVQRLAMLLYPVIPYAAARIWKQLGLGSIQDAAAQGELRDMDWSDGLSNTKLGPLGPIFPRADKGLAQIMTDMEEKQETGNRKQENPATAAPDAGPRTSSLAEPSGTLNVGGSAAHSTGADASIVLTPPAVTTAPADAPTESTPQIGIEDFAKIDLRVAQIVLAERIPKADKLLRLEVDLGPHGKRQILSGIAEFYTPEELVGRRIVVITNLAPRKMRGLESHGMLLAASETEGGKPALATCGDEIALGARLK